MGALAKLLMVGGVVGVGAVVLAGASKTAGAAPRVPAGFKVPANAARVRMPAVNGGIAIEGAEWPAEPGQPPGHFTLLWDPADPETFVALFAPAATPSNPGVMSVGTNANSQLLLSTLPNIIARMKAAGL
jgi:hypothetical protein